MTPSRRESPAEQFQAVEELLERWLGERRALLCRYNKIVVALDGQPAGEMLALHQHALCELLVDYASAGHFEVFHELVHEAECFADGSCALAGSLMPAIGDTTEVILAYEEKYGASGHPNGKLRRDLSALGEVLESRFVLEDRLIAGLHNRHRRLVDDRAPEQPTP
jgi:regulator of sigma D